MQAKTFNALEIQRMATRLANLLKRAFLKYGDQGAGMGIFPIVGRGDGSLNDSYRLAEPSDDIKDYHNQLNSLQPKHGPFFVHTRPNMYERRGMLIPHITGHPRSGSHLAMYERGQLINLITELILRTAFALNHKPGLILPTVSDKAQVVIVCSCWQYDNSFHCSFMSGTLFMHPERYSAILPVTKAFMIQKSYIVTFLVKH